jgi:hypothetical protein
MKVICETPCNVNVQIFDTSYQNYKPTLYIFALKYTHED